VIRLTLRQDPVLLPGTAAMAADVARTLACGGSCALRLGCTTVSATVYRRAPAGELRLARDLWERLGVPLRSMDLAVRRNDNGELELGPSVAVLYPGRSDQLSSGAVADSARFYFGHTRSVPGLFAIAGDESIDWERGTIDGFVVGQRLRRPTRATFPIPAVVRLTWAIRTGVIAHLRERTSNRTFNWVRSIGKWEQHTLLRTVPEVAPHLPETRLLRNAADILAMVAAHGTVFVKHVHGIQGRRNARVRLRDDGLEVSHMDRGHPVEHLVPPGDLNAPVRSAVGEGRCIVQQGIPLQGLEGRALHFRVVTVRRPDGGWRCPVVTASVAPDKQSLFTNAAHGATDEDPVDSLRRHFGMRETDAAACITRMTDLCLAGAPALAERFDPLGILGWDVAVEAGTHRLWLLEANAVPGWGYPDSVERDLARSQIDYALALSGFPL
jgi:hypothetical protein